MSWIGVLLAVVALALIFGAINYFQSIRAEKAQAAWFEKVLPRGETRQEFLQKAPFEFRPLAGKGYGILDKRSGQEVWKAKTPEEAEAWIVTNTLAEQGRLPKA